MSKALTLPPGAYTGVVQSPAHVPLCLGRVVSSLRAAWKEWRTYHDDVAHLCSMDERMLKDIGLSRSEIGIAVRFGRHND